MNGTSTIEIADPPSSDPPIDPAVVDLAQGRLIGHAVRLTLPV